jgi:hypothetical protein
MTTTTLVAPLCGGKIRCCIETVRDTLQAISLAIVRVVLSGRLQGPAFRFRLLRA